MSDKDLSKNELDTNYDADSIKVLKGFRCS